MGTAQWVRHYSLRVPPLPLCWYSNVTHSIKDVAQCKAALLVITTLIIYKSTPRIFLYLVSSKWYFWHYLLPYLMHINIQFCFLMLICLVGQANFLTFTLPKESLNKIPVLAWVLNCFDRIWNDWEHIPAMCALLRRWPLSAVCLNENGCNSSGIFCEVKN